jgi:hypothetical protein
MSENVSFTFKQTNLEEVRRKLIRLNGVESESDSS